jgi:hypothetical protein
MYVSKKLVALIAAVAAVAAGTAAFAAIPDGAGVIHGCYDKGSGQLRLTDPATNAPKGCSNKEVALDWNRQGPKGDSGVSQGVVLSRPDPKPVSINTNVGAATIGAPYLVSAKVVIGTTQHDFSIPFCSLYSGPDQIDQSRATAYGPGGGLATLYLTGAKLTAGSVYVVCTEPDGYARDVVITATALDDLGNI